MYFVNLTKQEYFTKTQKETEWRLNPKTLIPLVDLLGGRWKLHKIALMRSVELERYDDGNEFRDISNEVYFDD